ILLLPSTILCLLVLFTACKKEKGTSTDNSAEVSAQSDDQARFSDATEAVANDADAAIEFSPSFTGRMAQGQTTVCHADVAFDSVSATRTITITYNGADCFGTTTRTGVVVLSMAAGVHWQDENAAVSLAFQNLKVTRVS